MKPKLISLFIIIFFVRTVNAQTLSFNPVISGLNQPIQLVHAGDGSNRIFIVHKTGLIRVYSASYALLGNFLTVSPISTGGEQGLLSMAFHPDYETNGFFFVYYNTTAGDLEIARYKVSADPNVADVASKVVVVNIPHPTNTNHNGGELHFGTDGYLYLTTGDGGGGGDPTNNAQNTSRLLGKMLRFNVNTSLTAPYYTVPATNPYGNEVFALGLRNPFRWSFDRLTGDVWIGDVGQDVQEEINFRAAASALGTNYGWRCYEGTNPYNTAGCLPASSYTAPAHTYATQNPAAAITGGVVYRGTVYPDMYGYYISADYYSGTFYKLIPNGVGGWTVNTQASTFTSIADFGETEDGELYAVSLQGGFVSRISSGAPAPVTLISFTGKIQEGKVQLNWLTSSEINVSHYEIQLSRNGTQFTNAGNVSARNINTGSRYDYHHKIDISGLLYYRLRIVDLDGTFSYSPIIKLVSDNGKRMVNPSVINNNLLQMDLPVGVYNRLELINSSGAIVMNKNISSLHGFQQVTINVAKGVYVIRLIGEANVVNEKVVIQ